MLTVQVTVFPDVLPEHGGGFRPGSFDHMLHLQIHQPGLDPGWEHTLVDALVADDGASANLTIHSQPHTGVTVDRVLRLVTWQPAAHVRAHDTDGNVIAEARLDAPLQPGQLVEFDGRRHRVAPAEHHELWPHRDTETGICRGERDWQHVVLIDDLPVSGVPRIAS